MTPIWTRTRRYMAIVWGGTIVLEAVVLMLAQRTNNSWFLLLALLLLLLPLAAMDATWRWFGREPRKRWKRHDVEDGLVAAAAQATAQPLPVSTRTEPAP
jgi:cytochrome bd-type quinol oxidase subunit 1